MKVRELKQLIAAHKLIRDFLIEHPKLIEVQKALEEEIRKAKELLPR